MAQELPSPAALPAEMFEPLQPEAFVPAEQLARMPQTPQVSEVELPEDPRVLDALEHPPSLLTGPAFAADAPATLSMERIPLGHGVEGESLEVSLDDVAEEAANANRAELGDLDLGGNADEPVPLAAASEFIYAEPQSRSAEVSFDATAEVAIQTSTLAELAGLSGDWSPQVQVATPEYTTGEHPLAQVEPAEQTTGPVDRRARPVRAV